MSDLCVHDLRPTQGKMHDAPLWMGLSSLRLIMDSDTGNISLCGGDFIGPHHSGAGEHKH